MSSIKGFSYAQVRIQARYGKRADASVRLRLHNIQDLGSFLQTAQQTPLRHWVLGLSPEHDSHDIELALREKFRRHVDEVSGWVPVPWRGSLQWIKRMVDLPVLRYLAAGGEPLKWMKSDSAISAFTVDDLDMRLQIMQGSDCKPLLTTWKRSDSLIKGWLIEWERKRPRARSANDGLDRIDALVLALVQSPATEGTLERMIDYEPLYKRFRTLFRRYAFQPAAVCAYLAIVAIDLHWLRSELMLRLFWSNQDLSEELPI